MEGGRCWELERGGEEREGGVEGKTGAEARNQREERGVSKMGYGLNMKRRNSLGYRKGEGGVC